MVMHGPPSPARRVTFDLRVETLGHTRDISVSTLIFLHFGNARPAIVMEMLQARTHMANEQKYKYLSNFGVR